MEGARMIRRRYLGGSAALLGGLLAAACGEPTVRYVGQPQAGPAGPAGPQGAKGTTGAQGAQGAQGTAGKAAEAPVFLFYLSNLPETHPEGAARVANLEEFNKTNELNIRVDLEAGGRASTIALEEVTVENGCFHYLTADYGQVRTAGPCTLPGRMRPAAIAGAGPCTTAMPDRSGATSRMTTPAGRTLITRATIACICAITKSTATGTICLSPARSSPAAFSRSASPALRSRPPRPGMPGCRLTRLTSDHRIVALPAELLLGGFLSSGKPVQRLRSTKGTQQTTTITEEDALWHASVEDSRSAGVQRCSAACWPRRVVSRPCAMSDSHRRGRPGRPARKGRRVRPARRAPRARRAQQGRRPRRQSSSSTCRTCRRRIPKEQRGLPTWRSQQDKRA